MPEYKWEKWEEGNKPKVYSKISVELWNGMIYADLIVVTTEPNTYRGESIIRWKYENKA